MSSEPVKTGPDTPLKDEHFSKIVRTHAAITKAVIDKELRHRRPTHPRYVYADLTAGDGVSPEGRRGSPLLFLDAAADHGLDADVFLIEHNPSSAAALSWAVAGHPAGGRCRLLVGDNAAQAPVVAEYVEAQRGWVFGLAYADRNGGEPPWAALGELARRAKTLDLLVHISATGVKRIRGAAKQPRRLTDDLRAVGKKHIVLRRSVGQWQWTFALLTNWDGLMRKLPPDWFVPLDSRDGREIADRLDLNEEEWKDRVQPALPFVLPTATTPSTYGTRVSAPSVPWSSTAPAAVASGAVSDRPPSRTTSGTHLGGNSTCPRT